MFNKTVDSVIAHFKKAADDLELIANQQEVVQSKLEAKMDVLHGELQGSEREQTRARKISANLNKLLEE